MNSAEEISKYSDSNSHYRSPTLARRAGTELDEPHPAKPPKKEKKWSLGGLFRRRKKEVESESSSEGEAPQKRGFLLRRKQRKEDKRKKRGNNKSLGHFDHIVVTPLQPVNNHLQNGTNYHDDSGGILSDPTIGYPGYPSTNTNTNSSSRRNGSFDKISSRESLSNKNRHDNFSTSRGSIDSGSLDGKKSRKGKVKARVEAIRDQRKNDSSSDEGSQRSTASSITRFKSDDSLGRKDGTNSRRTRSARTERHNRRLTKEDEHVLDKEAEMEKQRTINSDNQNNRVQVNRWTVVDEKSKSPPIKPYIKPALNYSPSVQLPQKSFSGVSTIPPSHNLIHRTTSNLSDNQRNYFNASHKPTNIYSNPLRNQSDSFRNINRSLHHQDFHPERRSFSYDCNINRSPTPNQEDQIIHVQFPLGKPVPKQRNPNLINSYSSNCSSNQSLHKTTPPPPPPRDPQRRFIPNQYENSRPMSYAFENGHQVQPRPVPVHQPLDRNASLRSYNQLAHQNLNRAHSFGWQTNYNHRSNSEDHIAQANNQNYAQQYLVNRPASATPDASQQRYIRRHPTSDQYKYFAEKTPRSRKPIHIAATNPTTGATVAAEQPYLSDSQVMTRTPATRHPVHMASEFWRQKDAEEVRRKSQLFDIHLKKPKEVVKKLEEKEPKKNFSILSIPIKSKDCAESLSSLSGTSDTSPLNSNSFFDQPDGVARPLSIVSERSEVPDISDAPSKIANDHLEYTAGKSSRNSSASSTDNTWNDEETEKTTEKKSKKSNNLEDALDELEAIYKSLKLGDEDLLDRAERREGSAILAQKMMSQRPDTYSRWGVPAGAQSDSGFSYDCLDALKKKKSKRSGAPDKINDDMAYRRMNKERPPPLDVNVAVSQVSYLLSSPILGNSSVDENDNEHISFNTNNEPDITLDDVVYRNLKHTNNTLKVADPQLPFGIPIGPITTASNSDYLHAVPENRYRSRFIAQKSPDIVTDDLAYRNLRKDSGFVTDDVINNNNTKLDSTAYKKRRAVRSITTNIYNMMHRDSLRATESDNEFDKAQSLTDIADAMEIAHKILKERQDKLFRTSVTSDNEARPANRSNNHTSTETLTDNKTDFKDMGSSQQKHQIYIPLSSTENENVNQKPPMCPTPDRKSSRPPTKESTPIRIASPAPDRPLTPLDRQHLEDLLTALAIEAQETSEKLGNDLKLLEEESRKCTPRLSPVPLTVISACSKSLDEKLSDIDAVSEHAKLCEKLLGAVVESTKLISHSIPSNHEHPVLEEVDVLSDEPQIFKSVANVVVTRKADNPVVPKQPEELAEECSESSDHDYENIIDTEEPSCTSPFEENKTKLLADFQELKKDLFSEVDDKLSLDVSEDSDECDYNISEGCELLSQSQRVVTIESVQNQIHQLQDSCSDEGEVCSFLTSLATPNASLCNPINDLLPPPEDFIVAPSQYGVVQNYAPILTRILSTDDLDDHDCEHSSGFHTESHGSSSADSSLNPTPNFLVVSRDTIASSSSADSSLSPIVNHDDHSPPCTIERALHDASSSLPSTSVGARFLNNNKVSNDVDDTMDSSSSWYRNPATLALACSVIHQLAVLDIVTLLGLLLAIVTVFAAIVL